MPPIYILLKPASGLCNLRCDYCFYCDEMQNRVQNSYGIMSIDTLEAVIKKTLSHAEGSCCIAFQGGEPTLAGLSFYKQVIDLQQKYNIKNLALSNAIQTNGTKMDHEWAKFFSKNKFLVGLSIDGVKSTHDAFRKDAAGDGTFARVKETSLLFTKNKVEYNILTVVNSKTAVNIERIYRFYQRSGFWYLQFIPCLEPIGAEPGQREYSLTPEIYGKFLCDLFDLWYADLLNGRQPFIRSFENYIGILCGIEPESCDMRGVCGVQYVVEADGSVYPCDFYMLDEYRLGNLLDNDFNDLDDRRRELGFIKKPEGLPHSCAECRWFALCRGGCKRFDYYFCSSFKQFFSHAGERMVNIAETLKKKNGGL